MYNTKFSLINYLDIAVGGLYGQKDHTKNVILMALNMLQVLETINADNGLRLKIRIGVCCGSCVGMY